MNTFDSLPDYYQSLVKEISSFSSIDDIHVLTDKYYSLRLHTLELSKQGHKIGDFLYILVDAFHHQSLILRGYVFNPIDATYYNSDLDSLIGSRFFALPLSAAESGSPSYANDESQPKEVKGIIKKPFPAILSLNPIKKPIKKCRLDFFNGFERSENVSVRDVKGLNRLFNEGTKLNSKVRSVSVARSSPTPITMALFNNSV